MQKLLQVAAMVSGAGFLGQYGQLLLSHANAAAAHVSCRHAFKGRAYVQRVMNIGTVAHELAPITSSAGDIEDASTGRRSHEENVEVHITPDEPPQNNFVGFQIPPATMDIFTKRWLLRTFNKESMSSDERAALHRAKMKEFRHDDFCNPIFETLWAPWAESVQYIHPRDPQAVFDRKLTSTSDRQIAMKYASYAIPTLPVLQYIAPDGKIAEIGSGLGHWALLLKFLGADVVAVDDFSEIGERGVEFIKQRMAAPSFSAGHA